jgi:hypothetical protein
MRCGVSELRRSRPVRAAATAAGVSEAEAERRFAAARVAVILADDVTDDADARETFLYAVNQCLRFAGQVAAVTSDGALAAEAGGIARTITGDGLASAAAPDISLVVSTVVTHDSPTVTVSADGWLARLATSASEVDALPRRTAGRNALGALAAACLGASQVFRFLATGGELSAAALELSLFALEQGAPGSLDPGPDLPARLELDALLVGCGGVMHGFIYALKRLPVLGRARAVDRQRLRDENLGPYVLSRLDLVGVKKAEIIKQTLAPTIEVTPYGEDLYPLFTTRLDRGHFPLPPIVVAGLDRVTPRHIVQRLWPDVLLDIGAGGESAQLIVKHRDDHGACVLELLDVPAGEQDELERLATESGLAPSLIRDAMDAPISQEDVAAAPDELRADMSAARERNELRCGFIRTRALDHEQTSDEFVAAVPFVVAFAGIAAAASLVKELAGVGEPASLRYQFSFASLRGRASVPHAAASCECRRQGVDLSDAGATLSR